MAHPLPKDDEAARLAWKNHPIHRVEWLGRLLGQGRLKLVADLGTPALPLDFTDDRIMDDVRPVAAGLFSEQNWYRICRDDFVPVLQVADWLFPKAARTLLRSSFAPGFAHPLFRNRATNVLAFALQRDWVDPEKGTFEQGGTWLHAAASLDWVDGVSLLLHHGVDPNAKNKKGRTALHQAAWEGSPEMVDLLMDSGAHVDARDDQSRTPLAIAALGSPGGYSGNYIPPNLYFAEALLRRGADYHQHTGKTSRSARLMEKMESSTRHHLEITSVKNRLEKSLPDAGVATPGPRTRL
jgi:hypothetical protein